MYAFVRSFLLLVTMLTCGLEVVAQTGVTAEAMTNRRLGYLNDASAVGWNPAMLGVHPGEFDLVGAGSFDRDFTLSYSLYGLFGKAGPVALGATGPIGDSVISGRRQYYAGFGIPIADDELWVGAGSRWVDGLGFGKSSEYTAAVLYRPLPTLLAGLSIGNLTSNNDAGVWLDVQTTFAPTDWLQMFGGLHYDQRDTADGNSPVSPTVGLTLGVGDNSLIMSGNYDFNRGISRFGVEFMLDGGSGVGSFNGLNENGVYLGGLAIARWSTLDEHTVGATLPGDVDDSDMGWAPDRAYVPNGLEYTQPSSNTDALRTTEAIERPCTGASGDRFDSPSGLTAIVGQAGAEYAPLATTLRQIAPDSKDLFRAIRRKFYSPPVRNRELSVGDTLSLYSKQSHAISVQSVDASRFPNVSVIMRVTDESGRTVSGLGVDDFSFRDPSTRIISVRPTDSSFKVPVDIVVMVDCSGSMSDEIEAVRQNVERFADNLEARGIDYRIGGVLYGSVIYDTLHPTSNLARYKSFLANAAPIGGDEITTLAIKAATEMEFRPGSQRVFVMITDDWTVQNNSRLNEAQLTQRLWDTRARLYSIITPCKNNSAVMTRLTLGREFDIRQPFTSILDEIGTDLTTTYELVYESQVQKEVVVPKVTILRGRVRDESGAPIATTITLDSRGGLTRLATNGTTAEFETEITEGAVYTARIDGERYLPLSEEIDLREVQQGDTITRDFVLRMRPTTVAGRVVDERGALVASDVRIEDAGTLEKLESVRAPEGEYSAQLEEGRLYRLTPTAKNYIPFPEEVNANVPKGTALTQDLKVMSIDAAVASGAVFRLKNIFFDFDRWDLKPESSREIDQLVALLLEYPSINVEIGAHTDSKGSEGYNLNLSARRAQSVREYLVAQGIGEERLTSKGYGESVPVATNENDEGRALNRRVEFKLVK